MEILNQVSQATGVQPRQLMQYGLVTAVALVMLGVGQCYITQVIGVAYPAFMSFVALESAGTEDDKQWLTYWVCFGTFNIIDQFAGVILSFIPFYYFLKLGFLVYLMHPSTMGATRIYNDWIAPYVEQYEGKIKQFEKSAADTFNQAKNLAPKVLQSNSAKMD